MLYLLYPQLRKLSGAERLICKLAGYAARQGAAVTLLTHHFAPTCRPALDPQVRLVETGETMAHFHNHYLDAPFEYTASLRLLPHVGSDAEALTFFGPPSLPALYASRHPLPRLYFCYEPPRFAYSDTNEIGARLGLAGRLVTPFLRGYRLVDRMMVRRADALLANSAFGAQLLAQAYHRPATVITHGADFIPPPTEVVNALRARLGLQDRLILLTVNFLHPRKRIDLFLRTLAKVSSTLPRVAGLVVGQGPEQPRLESLANELGLQDKLRFTGFVPDPDLPAYYALSDVYVHPGKLETFGLSVLEAAAAGLAVVSVAEGGPCEIILNGETGYLVEAQPECLAERILLLLNDPARRHAMGEAARTRAAVRYTWQAGARTFLDVVSRLTPSHA